MVIRLLIRMGVGTIDPHLQAALHQPHREVLSELLKTTVSIRNAPGSQNG
jgi:hypothetical protein